MECVRENMDIKEVRKEKGKGKIKNGRRGNALEAVLLRPLWELSWEYSLGKVLVLIFP